MLWRYCGERFSGALFCDSLLSAARRRRLRFFSGGTCEGIALPRLGGNGVLIRCVGGTLRPPRGKLERLHCLRATGAMAKRRHRFACFSLSRLPALFSTLLLFSADSAETSFNGMLLGGRLALRCMGRERRRVWPTFANTTHHPALPREGGRRLARRGGRKKEKKDGRRGRR